MTKQDLPYQPRQGTHNWVGTSPPRSDGLVKVTGAVTYVENISWPGLAVGQILRSPYSHARVLGIDARRALALPGVYAVLTGQDLRDGLCTPYFGPIVADKPVVAIDRVCFAGDPVAAVAAVDMDTARAAMDLIEVGYDPLPHVTDVLAAIAPGAPVLHPDARHSDITAGFPDLAAMGPTGAAGSNICGHFRLRKGDVVTALAASEVVVADEFYSPMQQHCALEPHACIAGFQPDGSLDIWSTSQHPYTVRKILADIFGLPLNAVRLRVPYIGGGFGSKSWINIEALVVALARKARRPVKVVLDREGVFYTRTKHGCLVRMQVGARRDGHLQAARVEAYYDTGAYCDNGPRVAKNAGIVSAGPYRIPSVWVDSYAVYTNKPSAGGYRGYGVCQVAWAHEQMLDLLAARLGLDPLLVRLRNAAADGDPFHTGQILEGTGVGESLEAVAARLGWVPGAGPPPPREVRPGVWQGVGIACGIKATASPAASAATIKLDDDGSAILYASTVEIGQGAETVLVQIAAEGLGLSPDRIRIHQPDTAVTPWDHATSSSQSTFRMGNAVLRAAADLQQQILAAAAGLLEVSPADLEVRDGVVRVCGAPDRNATFARVMQHRYGGMQSGTLVGRGDFVTQAHLDPETGQGRASAFWETGAVGCTVEVDTATGVVRVGRLVTAVDLGKAINPELVHGQVHGSIAMGLGITMHEEMVFHDGVCVNPNFLDYPLPTLGDMPPALETILIEKPHPDGPFGAHGVGEAGIFLVAPAVANAVAHATGVRVKQLPLTAERVLGSR